jgi:hypothetical protein
VHSEEEGLHSLFCSLEEEWEENEDEVSFIGRGEIGRMLPWREAYSLGLCCLMVITSYRRRAH